MYTWDEMKDYFNNADIEEVCKETAGQESRTVLVNRNDDSEIVIEKVMNLYSVTIDGSVVYVYTDVASMF